MKPDYSTNQVIPFNTLSTLVIDGRWELLRININKKGASSNTLALYNVTDASAQADTNLKQVILATIDTTDSARSIPIEAPFFNGIKIVMATGTAADCSVIIRPMANS